MKKICIVTGSRAEYGLLYWLAKDLEEHLGFELQILVTGTHLSPEFGMTINEIKRDGFNINKKIEILLSSDTGSAITKSTALALIGFSDAFSDLNPDVIIVLGDRYEILGASIAALFAKIPIAHIHGGEVTEGSYDESIRHSITKMAWWHFVATKEYKKRVIQLGENPSMVYLVGGMGVDCLKRTTLLSKPILEKSLGFKFEEKNLIVTYHPVTLGDVTSEEAFNKLLICLKDLNNTKIIFTHPNSDTDGYVINTMINDFVTSHPLNTTVVNSMGRINYLSTLQYVDGVVGNSSSGLLEAPSLNTGTINIGDRQKGRIRAESIIDCKPTITSIKSAIKKLYTKNYIKKLKNVKNPYDHGSASKNIINILNKEVLPKQLNKKFFDI